MLYVALLLGCGAVLAALPLGRIHWITALRHRLRRSHPIGPVQVDPSWQVIPGNDSDGFRDWINNDDFHHPQDPGFEASLGSHLLIEMYGCDSKTLEREEAVREAMEEAARRSNASLVTSSFHEFKPYGVSGAVIIQESHYTIHTWPEHQYAAIDLFYCGNTVLVDKAVEALQERFHPKNTRYLLVRRGLQNQVEQQR